MESLIWFFETVIWKGPRHLLRRQTVEFRRMASAPTGNARPLVFFNIFWTIPNAFLVVYLQLFMAERGLSKIEIGTITSAQVAVQMIGALCGGYLADRLGRIRTIRWVDILCWPAAYLCFSTADGYLGFLAGAVLIGGVFTLLPAWSAEYLRGSPPEKRLQMFGLLQMPWFLGSILIFPAYFVVDRFGVTDTCRLVFALGSASTLAGWYLRGRLLVETDAPRRPLRPNLREVKHLLTGHWLAFQALVRRRQLTYVFFIQVLFQAAVVIAATYNYLYLADPRGVGLAPRTLAFLPLFGGCTNLLTTLTIVPFVSLSRVFWFLGGGLAFMALNASLLLIAPLGSLQVVLTASVCGAAGFAVYNPSVSTVWSNLMTDKERPRILAFTTVASMMLTMPIPTLAGALYNLNPRGPLLTILWIYALMAVCAILAASQKRVTKKS